MEKITIQDLTRFKFPSTLRKNKSESKIAFMLHEMDEEENKYLSNLWLMDVKTETFKKFTADGKTGAFYWEDDSTILFKSARDKDEKKDLPFMTKIFRISTEGGEADLAFTLPVVVTGIKTIKKDAFYVVSGAFKNGDELPYNAEKDALKSKKERIEKEKDYEVLTEIPFWSNGGGYTSNKRTGLFLFNKKEGTFKRITEDNMNITGFDLSDDGKKILYVGSIFISKAELNNHLFEYDIETEETRQISPEAFMNYDDAIYFNDVTIITRGSNMQSFGVNENKKFYKIDRVTKEMVCITPELDMGFWNSVGSDARFGSGSEHNFEKYGDSVYFVSTDEDRSLLYKLELNGTISTEIDKKGSVDHFCLLEDKIVEIAFRGSRLPELYIMKDGEEKQISTFNEWIQNDRLISKPEEIILKRENRPDIQGWMMKPVDFEEGKKYPAILDIHGGPKTVYGDIFFHEMQVWASSGYCVFFCNPRGSDGKGNKFADIRGKYGTIDYDDLMDFTNLVLERYDFIDGGNIGVTGGSYGGYMTNWIIGQTDRFKAAASQRSISNWISKFCTTDIGYFFVEDQSAGATPWDNHEQLWKSSPLKYADKVKTPTLFIHSEEDYRCWYPEGLQMFTAIKYHGVEARLCMFRGETHELSRSGLPLHRMRRLQEIQDWFDKHLK
ncbi:MAG TPA: S9 family peptidase [Thermotogota bacterium]|nr:S9 family peptidase [Thermotogota bacterium]